MQENLKYLSDLAQGAIQNRKTKLRKLENYSVFNRESIEDNFYSRNS